MTEIRISAVNAYLADAGWSPTGQTWHEATIWSQGTEEVLVPPRDGMGDSTSRVRDLLLALENVERRPADDIARDIAYPLLDRASYRALEETALEGFVALPTGLGALQGIYDMLQAAAATMHDSPRFPTLTAQPVSELLAGVHLGTTTSQSFVVTLLVPADESRRVLEQLYVATAAVHSAVQADAFEDPTAAGPSAEFCAALSSLAGSELQQPFELEFRWARGLPSDLPDTTIGFPPGAGERIREVSRRFGPQAALPAAAAAAEHAGPTIITGRVESLHDNDGGTDRWRVKVRGQVRSENQVFSRRSIWIRLSSQEQYDVAWAAHRNHQQVQITGLWTASERSVRLVADPDGIVPTSEP
ncbi:hypothetical protein ACIBL3_41060 [Kribbella sp. NPDC050124]|uniref:hypothetical protein n=1 Tax=Kribbella sp. NPDC050124 TaxID=3364114 RepID=UPI003790D930